MSNEHGSTGVETSNSTDSPVKAVPGRGEILIWSVHFPARDEDSSEEPTPTLTASVCLDDQEGVVVSAKPAHPIDYQSGVIRRGSAVEVRYENPETASTEDDPAMLFELIDIPDPNIVDSDTGDGDGADSGTNSNS